MVFWKLEFLQWCRGKGSATARATRSFVWDEQSSYAVYTDEQFTWNGGRRLTAGGDSCYVWLYIFRGSGRRNSTGIYFILPGRRAAPTTTSSPNTLRSKYATTIPPTIRPHKSFTPQSSHATNLGATKTLRSTNSSTGPQGQQQHHNYLNNVTGRSTI